MAKKSITGGASFQSILLQSDSTQIENIGIAIYQMHRYYSGKFKSCERSYPNPFSVSGVVKDHVIEYFLNNIIGNKDKLKVSFSAAPKLFSVTLHHNDLKQSSNMKEYFA